MSRIKPLSPPYPDEIQADFDRIMPTGAPPLALFRAIATSRRAWRKFRDRSLLDRGPLSLRQREIVIDRASARSGCEYEWGVHIAAFSALARLTDDQVRATVAGDMNSPCWSDEERILIATVDALHDRATLSEAEFSALAAHYSPEQILEILMLAGFYRTVAYIANGLAIANEPGAPTFPAGR
jgi:alkylhydroperoxidase family enzyme